MQIKQTDKSVQQNLVRRTLSKVKPDTATLQSAVMNLVQTDSGQVDFRRQMDNQVVSRQQQDVVRRQPSEQRPQTQQQPEQKSEVERNDTNRPAQVGNEPSQQTQSATKPANQNEAQTTTKSVAQTQTTQTQANAEAPAKTQQTVGAPTMENPELSKLQEPFKVDPLAKVETEQTTTQKVSANPAVNAKPEQSDPISTLFGGTKATVATAKAEAAVKTEISGQAQSVSNQTTTPVNEGTEKTNLFGQMQATAQKAASVKPQTTVNPTTATAQTATATKADAISQIGTTTQTEGQAKVPTVESLLAQIKAESVSVKTDAPMVETNVEKQSQIAGMQKQNAFTKGELPLFKESLLTSLGMKLQEQAATATTNARNIPLSQFVPGQQDSPAFAFAAQVQGQAVKSEQVFTQPESARQPESTPFVELVDHEAAPKQPAAASESSFAKQNETATPRTFTPLQQAVGKQQADPQTVPQSGIAPAMVAEEQASTAKAPVNQAFEPVNGAANAKPASANFAPLEGAQAKSAGTVMASATTEKTGASSILERVVQVRELLSTTGGSILKLVKDGGGKMTLRLDPPTLGKMQVEVEIVNRQCTAKIFAEDSTVKHALLQGASHLREALESQGLKLQSFEVELQNQNQQQHGQEFFSREDAPGQRGFGAGEQRRQSNFNERENIGMRSAKKIANQAAGATKVNTSPLLSGIDLRV